MQKWGLSNCPASVAFVHLSKAFSSSIVNFIFFFLLVFLYTKSSSSSSSSMVFFEWNHPALAPKTGSRQTVGSLAGCYITPELDLRRWFWVGCIGSDCSGGI
jgi:hypothetical protein